ncbi:hypothetical protein Peur_052188 [Populus x canadensis]
MADYSTSKNTVVKSEHDKGSSFHSSKAIGQSGVSPHGQVFVKCNEYVAFNLTVPIISFLSLKPRRPLAMVHHREEKA